MVCRTCQNQVVNDDVITALFIHIDHILICSDLTVHNLKLCSIYVEFKAAPALNVTFVMLKGFNDFAGLHADVSLGVDLLFLVAGRERV